MRTIRASEIGVFKYCQRAWWYHSQGIESSNQVELSAGSEMHRQHGRQVFFAGLLRGAAFLLLMGGLVLMAVFIAQQVIP
jgi:hypothetical protein